MVRKNMENEDLCMAVFRRLSKIGFDIRNPKGEYAVLQFIIKYVISFLSNEQFQNGEYDIEMTSNSIKVIIDTPDTKEINVRLLDSNIDSLISGIEVSTDNYVNGLLKIYSNGNTGVITCTLNALDTTETYRIDTNSEKFAYTYALNYADREDILFSGELAAIGTAIKNNEYFYYERLYPEMEQSSGVLNSIRRKLSPTVIKRISKPNIDASIYDNVFLVFDVLKNERDKVLSPKTKKVKKLTKETE